MKAVIPIIRILVIIQVIENIRCQGFGEGDIFRYFSLGNGEEVEPVTGYSANVVSNDVSSQALPSLNLQQYQVTEDFEQPDEYSRADFARTKKLFRIKNPFQQQSDNVQQSDNNNNNDQHDNNHEASNQYTSLQFSLPPDDFMQKMKTENQFYQQQLSTPAPNTGFVATPLPPYQFSTISSSTYDNNNLQSNRIQFGSKISQSQNFLSNGNNYQYSTPNTFSADIVQSTPSPYSPTPLPNNNQFVGTASNPYISSSIPLFLSSPQNTQSFISSPYSQTTIQSSLSDYNNKGSSNKGNSEGYDKNDGNQRIQVEYYDNSVNGVKYPIQQYQNEYQPTTIAPPQSPYNTAVNALSKSLQELSLSQIQNIASSNNPQDIRNDGSVDNFNSDTHRANNFPSSNAYFNYIQRDYANQHNQKIRPQEGGQETAQTEHFSNGDFGWKLGGKKFVQNLDTNSNDNFKTYHPSQSGGEAVSHVSFHMDTGRHYNYDQIPKATSDNTEAQEFIKAVGKSLERSKQPLQYRGTSYHAYSSNNQQPQSAALTSNGFQDNVDNQRNNYNENQNIFSFGNSQPDLVTASPVYPFTSREINNERTNSLFDHAKALKAIVPIDVSNVVGNSEFQGKNSGFEGSSRFNIFNFNQEQSDQNLKQFNRPIADAYYKDKNYVYGFNIRTKPEDFLGSDTFKHFDQNTPLLSKQQQTLDLSQNIPINFAGGSSSLGYNPQQETQSYSNQQETHRFQNQVSPDLGVFKVTDGPYHFTQGISTDYRSKNNNLEQNGIPAPLSGRINQNLNSHQLDVSSRPFDKFVANKPPGIPFSKPDSEGFNGVLPTINGFKVANPFNVDMKLVADVLKGRPTVDESHLLPFRDQFNKASPPRLDLSQLQFLLKNENNLAAFKDGGSSSLSTSYFEPYNGRFPYQGVKYSRSQEEEESIPITDTASSPYIGAVMDQDDTQNESELTNEQSEATAEDEESITLVNLKEEKPKKVVPHRIVGDRHIHPNTKGPNRHTFQRKYPRTNGPHPFYKPTASNKSRSKVSYGINEHPSRKRRLNKPPTLKILVTEPLYAANSFSEIDVTPLPILLRPPPQVAEDKSDNVA